MTDVPEDRIQSVRSVTSSTEGFDQIRYWVSVPPADFNTEAFRSAVPASHRTKERGSLSFAPRDAQRGQYHAHLRWSYRPDRVSFEIAYIHGGLSHAEDEREPYAEDLMPWLGSFLGVATIHSHSHARFRFSQKKRAIRFPLAMATPPPCDAEVVGLALRLPATPQGAESVRLTLSGTRLYAEVVREGTITFNAHSLSDDMDVAVDVLNYFIEERTP